MGSVGWYAAMMHYGRVVVDTAVPYDKRAKAVHRCDIADTRGPLSLTVPLAKPSVAFREATWNDCAVSAHDEWWVRHRVTLESAYGRTPFFEFLIDRFLPLLRDPAEWSEWPDAITFDRIADEAVRSLLAIGDTVEWGNAAELLAEETPEAIVDLRRADFALRDQQPYWQVRDADHGFLPNLSILDLIFNLGPEAGPYLAETGRPGTGACGHVPADGVKLS